MGSEIILKTENLSKWYGNILGISEITLSLTPGVYGVLGPNGAGKSTFLKIISGQLKPNLGTLEIFHQPVTRNPHIFRRVGFCPEVDSCYSEVTGMQFLTFIARLHFFKPRRAMEKARTALDTVGLEESGGKPVSSYSLGMRQRLRIAASVIHEPDLLLLDEPLRGVDPLWRARIIQLVDRYRREGKTVIVSSHILPEIESMTSNITLIHQGKVFAHGDIHRIRSLIDTHPHQISIRCRHPRRLAEKLIRLKHIRRLNIGSKEETLVCETSQRDLFFPRLMKELDAEDYDVREITSPDDNLQSVFDYLIGGSA